MIQRTGAFAPVFYLLIVMGFGKVLTQINRCCRYLTVLKLNTMKKWIALAALTLALTTTEAQAQPGGGDPAAMLARMKERVKPELVEKAKLTDAQADKVVEIQFESRQQMRGLRELSEDDRKKKMETIQADLDKKYKAIPLTDEQIKSVNAYYEEMRRNFQQRQGG